MADIASPTAVAVAAGTGSASLAAAGSFLGAEYAVILLALLGGATSLIYLSRMGLRAMIASVFGSTVLGVVSAQLAAGILIDTVIHFAPWLDKTLAESHFAGRMLIAFCVGFIAQKAVPIVFRWMENKGVTE